MKIWLKIFLSILSVQHLWGQAYIMGLPDVEETYNRRLARFSNGDILIGDSSDEGVSSQASGKIFLSRIDHCGRVTWSYSYERSTEYLEFKGVVLNEQDQIFAYGSAYRGGQELLFLLKADRQGSLLSFRLIETGTIDHSSFSISYKDKILMLYGLQLHFNTRKLGYVAIFDEGLGFLKGWQFTPFESEGEAIIDSRNHYACLSGPYHYLLNPDGELIWGLELDRKSALHPVAGPFEVPGGYIFQAFKEGYFFFYKLSFEGKFLWKSEKIANKRYLCDFSLNSQNEIIAVYNQKDIFSQKPALLIIDNQTGLIREHRILRSELNLDAEVITQTLDAKGNLSILGNKALIPSYPLDMPYFLCQVPLEEMNNSCLDWELVDLKEPNNFELTFLPIDTPIINGTMVVQNSDAVTQVFNYEFPLYDHCGFQKDIDTSRVDTLMSCGDQWTITLPASDFFWDDFHHSTSRVLSNPGNWSASNRNCFEPEVVEFTLDKPWCGCEVFLPNIVSANGDGINDRMQLFSGCDIVQFKMKIFDRWGNQIYEDLSLGGVSFEIFRDLTPGLYLSWVEYLLQDESGNLQEGKQVQPFTLIH